MAYREKIAWITLGFMVIAYTIYFAALIAISRAGEPGVVRMITLFAGITVVQMIGMIVASAVMAIRGRDEAQNSPDERDRAVARRGITVAYFVLMAGMFLVGVVMPFTGSPWKVYNAALFTLVTAETVRYLVIVVSYRRGWHG